MCVRAPVATEKKIGHIQSFFELNALDIDKNVVNFEQFRNTVTVITNVASYCGEYSSKQQKTHIFLSVKNAHPNTVIVNLHL